MKWILRRTQEDKSLAINERGLTSANWTVYYDGTKRTRYSSVPTSDITAETVTADGLTVITCRTGHHALRHITWESPRKIGEGLDKRRSSFAPQGRAVNEVPASHPTQPIATRPLAIRKDGTWYAYSWDLTKNICEVFGPAGYIRTAYTYSPYGEVTADGDVTQPIQWSSEYNDTELGLVYYNFRHYNAVDGRWIGRDFDSSKELSNLYRYVKNIPSNAYDAYGLQTCNHKNHGSNAEVIDSVRDSFNPVLQWVGDKLNIWQLLKDFDKRAKNNKCCEGISITVIINNLDLLLEAGFNSYTLIKRPLKTCVFELRFAGGGYGGMKNKGERNWTSKASGTSSPFKHMKPDPKNPKRVIEKDRNGKQVSKPKPKGFDEYWNSKQR